MRLLYFSIGSYIKLKYVNESMLGELFACFAIKLNDISIWIFIEQQQQWCTLKKCEILFSTLYASVVAAKIHTHLFNACKASLWHKNNLLGRRPGLVVMDDDSCMRGCGFNPGTVYWMEIFSHWFVVKIVLFVWIDRK